MKLPDVMIFAYLLRSHIGVQANVAKG